MTRLIPRFALSCLLFFLVSFGRAQIVANTNIFYTPANSFVGIGTGNPQTHLHVSGHIAAVVDPGQSGFVQLWADNALVYKSGNVNGGLRFGTATDLSVGGWSEKMRITDGGNVLIGQTTQTNTSYKLDVNGNARMNKVVVNTNGADYVFDSAYHLRPLPVVEKYIAAYHHLPDVASADQMKKQGLDVGDNQTVLLKKIEELTLYAIQQQRQIEAQNKKMNDMCTEIEILKRLLKNK